jgi:hypothetical protein
MNVGSMNLADHVIVARESHKEISPLGVTGHLSFPLLHIGLLNRFRASSPKACDTLIVL